MTQFSTCVVASRTPISLLLLALMSSGCLTILGEEAEESQDDSETTLVSAPTSIEYGEKKYFIKSDSVADVTPTVSGGTPTSFSLSGTLPAGLSFSTSRGKITGTPTATMAETPFTVTASNSAGSVSDTFLMQVYAGYLISSTGDQDDADAGVDGICLSTGGGCTLRAAMTEIMNVSAGRNAILIPADTQITLGNGGVMNITDSVQIFGEDRKTSIIDGDGATVASPSKLFVLGAAGKTISFENFTIAHFNKDDSPVFTSGFNDNTSITIKKMIFSKNVSSGDSATFSLWGANSTLSISDTEFFYNVAAGMGGAFTISGISSATVTRSLFNGNGAGTAGGAIACFGDLTVINSTFVDNSTTSGGGGAIWMNADTLTSTNNTFVNNQAPGAFAAGAIHAVNANLKNNILWNNTGTFDQCYFTGVGLSTGGNVVAPDDSNCNFVHANDIAGGTDPELETLEDNGGYTQTMLPGGNMLNAGIAGGCPSTDQRGEPRPSGSSCEPGAVEIQE